MAWIKARQGHLLCIKDAMFSYWFKMETLAAQLCLVAITSRQPSRESQGRNSLKTVVDQLELSLAFVAVWDGALPAGLGRCNVCGRSEVLVAVRGEKRP